jgi:hypothetical protein
MRMGRRHRDRQPHPAGKIISLHPLPKSEGGLNIGTGQKTKALGEARLATRRTREEKLALNKTAAVRVFCEMGRGRQEAKAERLLRELREVTEANSRASRRQSGRTALRRKAKRFKRLNLLQARESISQLRAREFAPVTARAAKPLKRLKTAMGSYWKKLAWIWVWRHVGLGLAPRPFGVGATSAWDRQGYANSQRDKSHRALPMHLYDYQGGNGQMLRLIVTNR